MVSQDLCFVLLGGGIPSGEAALFPFFLVSGSWLSPSGPLGGSYGRLAALVPVALLSQHLGGEETDKCWCTHLE